MSRLVIAVGFADRRPSTVPQLVYLGRDASAMRAACDASRLPCLTVLPFAMGIPRANRFAAANAAAAPASKLVEVAAEAEADIADLENTIAARDEEIAALREQLARLTAAPATELPPPASSAPEPAAEAAPDAALAPVKPAKGKK